MNSGKTLGIVDEWNEGEIMTGMGRTSAPDNLDNQEEFGRPPRRQFQTDTDTTDDEPNWPLVEAGLLISELDNWKSSRRLMVNNVETDEDDQKNDKSIVELTETVCVNVCRMLNKASNDTQSEREEKL